jgi:hypothetical protein
MSTEFDCSSVFDGTNCLFGASTLKEFEPKSMELSESTISSWILQWVMDERTAQSEIPRLMMYSIYILSKKFSNKNLLSADGPSLISEFRRGICESFGGSLS